MEVFYIIVTSVLIGFSCSVLIGEAVSNFRRKEVIDEIKANASKTVQLNGPLKLLFIVLLIIVNIFGVLATAFPDFITQKMEMNYVAGIVIWWSAIIFDNVIVILLLTKATYDEEKIVVSKIFRKPKTFYIKDIIYFSQTGNLRIKTSYGSFILFNSFAGTNNLRSFLIVQKSKD